MSLKDLNVGKKTKPVPPDWTPEKRFISYEYQPVTPHNDRLQKMQRTRPGSESKGTSSSGRRRVR